MGIERSILGPALKPFSIQLPQDLKSWSYWVQAVWQKLLNIFVIFACVNHQTSYVSLRV